ncbi:histone deacetylase complex subunit SAP130 [Euwallacea fornicatus]|uniref:histone deacetylase complex subunit SAP130 n=1 Tax=Euwallacea fornicatus TaxID=995702 RepID=UPI00338FF4BF
MSGNADEDKESQKAFPLDLARSQISTVRTVESGKAPLVMTSQALRSVRVLAAPGGSSSTAVSGQTRGQTLITNLMPGTVIKQDSGRITSIVGATQAQPQVSGSLAIQRPTQLSLSATPIVASPNPTGASYHVPRGPAVVANLAAPRSNATTVRTPLVVTPQNSQTHTFVRPTRTLSPAQGAAWLNTNTTNVSQIKGPTAVISAPIRGTAITGKPQTIARPQLTQPVPTIRSSTLLTNAITIGQTVHSFKSAAGTVQIGSGVTVAQMLPPRTQAVVYNTNTGAQFTPAARITIATTTQSQVRPSHPRPVGSIASGTRLPVPISQVQAAQNTRMVTTVQPPNQRIPVVSNSQPQPVLTATTRLVTTQPSGIVGRVAINQSTVSGNIPNASNILTTQARISTFNLQSLMAVANGGTARVQQTSQVPKVITQPAATIHLTQISPQHLKPNTAAPITTAARTINVPASIVAQRSTTNVPPQAISIAAKVYTTNESQVNQGTTSVYIHAPLQTPRHPSTSPQSSPAPALQQVVPPPSVSPYSIASSEGSNFFYQNSAAAGSFQRAFVEQQSNAFGTQPQVIRPPATLSNQQFQGMKLGSVVVVDPSKNQPNSTQFHSIGSVQAAAEQQPLAEQQQSHSQLSQVQNKINSSPRPSILRKRDHEGSPLKAAKNLSSAALLQGASQELPSQAPSSPLSPPRPDSRENGHSSSGSTTISATSSPGLPEVNEDSNPTPLDLKDDEEEEESKPPVEMSPRKKPRKQQLTGNDNDENHDDMQFISENSAAKKQAYDSEGPNSDSAQKESRPDLSRLATLRKPVTASLLNGYRQTWKATHNHYQRHSDVRPKDERRPTIIDLANQNRVVEKVNGWKIHHLSTQMEDLAEQEQCVYNQLTDLLKFTESEENSKQNDREVNRVNELIKGNLQRIKIINDGMLEAKGHIMKVFNHQRHVNDILSRCVSKRNFKKREKS